MTTYNCWSMTFRTVSDGSDSGWLVFSVGDAVKYVAAVRPKYLAGATGVVTKINRTKVVVKIDTPVGKFAGNITTPTNLIEKV